MYRRFLINIKNKKYFNPVFAHHKIDDKIQMIKVRPLLNID